jgi:hypothetical protein
MTTHFITAEIDLNTAKSDLVQAIETEISKQGDPLRWAIASVDREKQIARVEAVVTQLAEKA